MSNLKNNNAALEALIEQVKALPEAGGEDVTAEVTAQTTLIDDLEATVEALPDAGSGEIETCTVIVDQCKDVYYTSVENGQLVAKHSAGASETSNHTFTVCRYSIIMCGNTHKSGESGVDSYGYMSMGYSGTNYFVAQITDAEAKISFTSSGHTGGSND